MGKKIVVGLMGIAIVVLAVSNFSARKELAGVKAALEQLEAEHARLGRESEDLSVQDEPTESVASVVSVPAEEQLPDETEEPEASGRRMMRSISKMMDNPAMNKMMAAAQRGTLDVMYADLADQLQLTGEEKEHFMELLLARQMNIVGLSMKMMEGSLTKEEQKALSAEMEEKNKLMKEEMEYFLNSADDVAEWEFYEKTMGDRMMLSQMEQTLGESDAALSDQTYRQLLEAMNEERTNYDFSSDLNDDKNMDMSAERFSKENIDAHASDIRKLNEQMIARAEGMLTPEQSAAFADSLKTMTEMQIAQLEMAAQMFGGK